MLKTKYMPYFMGCGRRYKCRITGKGIDKYPSRCIVTPDKRSNGRDSGYRSIPAAVCCNDNSGTLLYGGPVIDCRIRGDIEIE